MSIPEKLETDRLILRRWLESDLEPFARLNGDKKVMELFPRLLTFEETREFIEYIEENFDKNQFGLWAVERKDHGQFIGFVGLWKPNFKASFTPCVEIGWRLAKEHWGNGFAPEAAEAVLEDGFGRIELDEIMAFTSVHNRKSIRVMEKLGMKMLDNFEHPQLPEGHFLRPHVRYGIEKSEWQKR